MMPRGGAETRGDHLATVSRLAHELFVRDEIGELLERAAPDVAGLDPDSDDACLVAVATRDWEKARRIPADLRAEMTKLSSEGGRGLGEARENDDFEAFRPWLDRTLELKHRVRRVLPADGRPVRPAARRLRGGDADERGAARLRPTAPRAAGARWRRARRRSPRPSSPVPYPTETQHELSLVIAHAFGADERSFRLDPTVHPFCISFATQDVRLTTRYAEDDLHGSSIFSTMHEVGHGLYERGGDPSLDRSPLATGCSSALHESQSRLWENVIGRSLEFWRWFYPQFRDGFASVLADVPLERFHRAINRPRPSLIRVDADETTYGLHIILRFELEQELLFGGLATKDLPEAWNAKLEELVGVRPPNDRLGCLQDTHWAAGLFGYFPTYQLGNVLSVQIWERLLADLPTRTTRSSAASSARSTSGCASSCTGTGASSRPPRRSTGLRAARSTPSRTSATSRTRTPRSRRRSSRRPDRTASPPALAPSASTSRSRGARR